MTAVIVSGGETSSEIQSMYRFGLVRKTCGSPGGSSFNASDTVRVGQVVRKVGAIIHVFLASG